MRDILDVFEGAGGRVVRRHHGTQSPGDAQGRVPVILPHGGTEPVWSVSGVNWEGVPQRCRDAEQGLRDVAQNRLVVTRMIQAIFGCEDVVFVGQSAPEADDPMHIRNSRRVFGMVLVQPVQRLAGHLELSLDSRLGPSVPKPTILLHAVGKALGICSRPFDVP